MSALADVYRQRIESAIANNDSGRLCSLAAAFYNRLSESPISGWKIHEIIRCDAGVSIKIGENRYVSRCNSSGNWFISTSPSFRDWQQDPQHRVVEQLGVPFAFLEGVYEAIKSLEWLLECDIGSAKKQAAELRDVIDKSWQMVARLEARASRLAQVNRLPRLVMRKRLKCIISSSRPCDPPEHYLLVEDAKQTFKGVCGIYFVWRNQRIYYIGKAYDVGRRLADKDHPSQPTDYVNVVQMKRWQIHLSELYYIWKLKPPRNGQVKETKRDEQIGKKSKKVG